jgi:PPK2 family polyphosphate:nucleotide phosphotransferase
MGADKGVQKGDRAKAVLEKMIVEPDSTLRYDRRDPDEHFGWERDDVAAELARVVADIDELQHKLAAEARQSLLVVLQAMDAGGKDGTIRSVFGPLNAAGVRVTAFKAPVGDELEHDYLWRIHAATPERGEIAVWNRSHYEDVLVVRVRDLVPEKRWKRRYRHIREFERLLTDEGTHIVKINLHISNEEQRERLQERIDDPHKRWKFRMGDLDDRKLWPAYMEAYEAAISETSTADAPWYVVPANHKWSRDLAAAYIVRDVLERMDPELPPDDPAIEGTIVE